MGVLTPLPPGTCDTHVHVYDHRFPVSPDAVLQPPDASVDEYRRFCSELGVQRVVVVQPTTYGLDNTLQLQAVAQLGAEARAVVVIDDTVADDDLEQLTARGARGARFHMLPGGAVPWAAMRAVAERIAPLGWHIQLQMNGRELPERLADLRRMPTPLVIDHIGRFMPPVEPDHAAFAALRSLVDAGHCWIKLSAPYESSPGDGPGHPAVSGLVRVLVDGWAERMLWASNWPHPGRPEPPTATDLHRLVEAWIPDAAIRRRILVDNPAEVYGFDPRPNDDTPEEST